MEIDVQDRALVITPVDETRSGWSSAFEAMARKGDDAALDEVPIASSWDEAEWEWE